MHAPRYPRSPHGARHPAAAQQAVRERMWKWTRPRPRPLICKDSQPGVDLAGAGHGEGSTERNCELLERTQCPPGCPLRPTFLYLDSALHGSTSGPFSIASGNRAWRPADTGSKSSPAAEQDPGQSHAHTAQGQSNSQLIGSTGKRTHTGRLRHGAWHLVGPQGSLGWGSSLSIP